MFADRKSNFMTPRLSAIAFAMLSSMAMAQTPPAGQPVTQPVAIVQGAQNAAAAASAGGMMPAGGAPGAMSPAATAAISAGPGAISSLPITGGKGPTIEALSAAQRVEIDADVRKRMSKALDTVNPPTPAPVAVAPVNITERPVPVVRAPAADTTKTVVAIYGVIGQEVADIRMPDGTVVIAKAGSNVAGFEVVRVGAQAVEFIAPKTAKKAGKAHKSVAPQRVVHSSKPKAMPADGGLYIEPTPATVRVAVGGTFK